MKIEQYENENSDLNLFKFIFIIDVALKWNAMYTGIRNGVISAVLYAIFAVWVLIKKNLRIKISGTTKLIFGYLAYNILLMIVTLAKGYPFSLVLSETSNTLVPVLAFWIGKDFSKRQTDVFERIVVGTGILLLITGIYYNVFMNDPYYIAFLGLANLNFNLSWFSAAPRLTSFYGSVICGSIGCFVAILAFKYLISEGSLRSVKFWITHMVGVLLAILSLQRSAMLTVFIFTLFMLINCVSKKYFKFRVVLLYIIVIAIGIIVVQIKIPLVFDRVLARVDTFGSAVGERSGGWNNAFSNGILSTIFGYGFGTGGQRAIGLSATTVNDGNYFKIIFDLGLVGLLIFISICISSLRNALKNGSNSIVYIVICFCTLMQMIGSNLLTFGITAMLFWYCVGRISARYENGV